MEGNSGYPEALPIPRKQRPGYSGAFSFIDDNNPLPETDHYPPFGNGMTSLLSLRALLQVSSRWFWLALMLCGLAVSVSHGVASPAHLYSAGYIGHGHELAVANKDFRLRFESNGLDASDDLAEDDQQDWSALALASPLVSPNLNAAEVSAPASQLSPRLIRFLLPPSRASPQA